MNNIYDIDRTRTLPPIIGNDTVAMGVAQATSNQMATVANLIHLNMIYPRIDELSEELLDILAYDLHVDWYDYSHDIDTKRRVIKNSVKIHMKLGTKYAVETATSDIYAGSTVEEWFEYGGEPYFFRLNLDISEKGITTAQQFSLVERIYFYKNARSHLDYIALQWEDTTEIQLGGYSSLVTTLEIQPFLTTELHSELTLGLGGVTQTGTNLEIQPLLEREVNLSLSVETNGVTQADHSITIQPILTQKVTTEAVVGLGGLTHGETSLEIKPFLVKEIQLGGESGEVLVDRKSVV